MLSGCCVRAVTSIRNCNLYVKESLFVAPISYEIYSKMTCQAGSLNYARLTYQEKIKKFGFIFSTRKVNLGPQCNLKTFSDIRNIFTVCIINIFIVFRRNHFYYSLQIQHKSTLPTEYISQKLLLTESFLDQM